MDKHLCFDAGKVINFTHGEYSDFSNVALVVTVKDCDLPKLVTAFRRSHKPRDEWRKGDDPTAFPAWLIANGYCMPVDETEVHLGDYSEFSSELIEDSRKK